MPDITMGSVYDMNSNKAVLTKHIGLVGNTYTDTRQINMDTETPYPGIWMVKPSVDWTSEHIQLNFPAIDFSDCAGLNVIEMWKSDMFPCSIDMAFILTAGHLFNGTTLNSEYSMSLEANIPFVFSSVVQANLRIDDPIITFNDTYPSYLIYYKALLSTKEDLNVVEVDNSMFVTRLSGFSLTQPTCFGYASDHESFSP